MDRRRDRADWRRIAAVYGVMTALGTAGAAGAFPGRVDGDLRVAFGIGAMAGIVGVGAALRGLSRV
jgi:hypothetical protein